MKKVLLKTFTYPAEAYALQSKLESEGIRFFVEDGLTVGADPFLSNAIGGVKIKVIESDVEKALQILQAADQEKKALPMEPPKGMTVSEEYCPRCEEYPVFRDTMPWYKYLLAPFLIMLSYPPSGGNGRLCPHCGHEWEV